MASPGVILKTNDIVSRVPQFAGVVGAIVVPAPRGPMADEPTLVRNEADYLRRFTVRGRVEVGYDLAHFSAINYLQRNNRLYVVRPENGSSYGGIVIRRADAAGLNTALASNANLDFPIDYSFATGDVLLIYGADPGAWNNTISIALIDNSTKEPDSFYVVVYQDGNQVERILASLKRKRDGNGTNIYVEDVLKSSDYVRAVINEDADLEAGIKYSAATALGGGDDGNPITDGMMITAARKFLDSEGLKITLLMDGGRATPAYGQALAEIAETRGDSLALLSVPFQSESDSNYVNAIIEYVSSVLNLNTSAAAIYSPHLLITDRFNDRDVYVSPESYAGAVIGETADNFEIFYAPAGDNAAINVRNVLRRFSKPERDALYDARINPLRYTEGRGIRIWGQKTLLARSSFLDRVNVKLLLITIQPAITDLLEGSVFQLNDESTRSIIKARIDSYMEGIKGRRGVSWFNTVCDETNNSEPVRLANIINVTLQTTPNVAGEIINFGTELTSSGEVTVTAQ